MNSNARPTSHQADLTKLPRTLAPLTAQQGNGWQKPPFIATQPERHASTKDCKTWTDYATALATVQAGKADGISYILTEDDPLAAIDLDHCRAADTHSIDVWAQNFLDSGRHSYSEVTPSGTGCRIWGFADGDSLHKKFTLEIDNKPIAVELFRHTRKALTITGYKLDTVRELTNIDKVFDWAMTWAERRRERAAEAAAPISNGFNHNGSSYSLNEIEQIVENGAPAGANRSNLFHTIVGHYIGCGWSDEQILSHIQQFPNGIGGRYLSEGRLSGEIARSVSKYNAVVPPSVDTAPKAKTPQPEPDSEDDDEELNDDEPSQQNSDLPPLYGHGDQDGQPFKSWLIKNLIPACGHGLLSGQWGAGKTFVVFDLAAALGTCQPFLGHPVKRQCGVLLIAAEGANEVRLRLDAVIRTKCGNMQRAPFRWYETVPMLLHKGSVEKLIAMAKQAEASLLQEFGLPLGLIIIDTIAACAGYARAGDENDPAAGQAVMNILKAVAETIGCFVLGVDHFGKNLEAGTRGASSKEASGDLVLACLGDKEVSGSVVTRLAVRKNRAGRQGQEYPFVLRMVQTPEPDEDGEPVSTMVVDWVPASPSGAQPEPDPWAQSRRQDQRTAVLRLKRALMGLLADQGVELSIPPDGPLVRMIDQEIVRQQFYDHTPADGTPEQKAEFKRKRFNRAIDWVEDQQLIAIAEIDSITYLRLSRPEPEDHEQEDD